MVALAKPEPYCLPGEAARRLNITTFKLHRERKAGRIPECVRVGQYHVIPADKIDAIRARLIEAGRIPAAQVGDRAGVLTTAAS